MLTVTGSVTHNMRKALIDTYEAMPDPRWVVAIGACAAGGGLFARSAVVAGGIKDLCRPTSIRGCPPTPRQLLAGLMALLQK